MKPNVAHFVVFSLWATASACGGDFDPASRIDDLRVVAVRADAPYAAPGQRVRLEALAIDPAERSINWAWGLCFNPASPSAPGCLAALDDATVVFGAAMSTFEFTLPDDVITSQPAEGRAHASVGAVVAACPGALSRVPGALGFRCVDETTGGALDAHEYVVGVKRVFARAIDQNRNPVIAGITWDGAPWLAEEVKEIVACDTGGNDYGACSANDRHVVAVALPAQSSESGVDSFGEFFAEQVVVQFYATEGIFEHDVRLASDAVTGFVARRQSAAQTIRMWIVVRDDRGGVAWEERRVHVAPR
jgi:hypothetical protein